MRVRIFLFFLLLFFSVLPLAAGQEHGLDEECVSCHFEDSPQRHYIPQCAVCHKPGSWSKVVYDHQLEMKCVRCHRLSATQGKHWTGECSFCHNTDDWENAS